MSVFEHVDDTMSSGEQRGPVAVLLYFRAVLPTVECAASKQGQVSRLLSTQKSAAPLDEVQASRMALAGLILSALARLTSACWRITGALP